MVEDELPPPEPAINLSNRLNPNNIHYDRELAARWAAAAAAGCGCGCMRCWTHSAGWLA
jgi:hypothetical protein